MDAAVSTAVKTPTVKLMIGGKLVESKTTQWRDIVNPATQEVLARVPFCTMEEVDAAVASAQEAFKTWKKTPIGARARIFLKLQQLIRENMGERARPWPTLKVMCSVGWRWWNTLPALATCSWVTWPTTWPTGWTPTRCCSRWACARASRRSTSRP